MRHRIYETSPSSHGRHRARAPGGQHRRHLGGATKRIRLRQAAIFYKADLDCGTQNAKGLGLKVKEVGKLARMSQDERVKATSA